VPAAVYALLVALVLGAIALGGGLYETILIDRSWPRMPAIIQPDRGGINRKLFWGPAHGLFELALLVASWLAWAAPTRRFWVITALVAHFGTRAWSFAYFIPAALRFEAGEVCRPAQQVSVDRWVKLSRCRVLLDGIAVLALAIVLVDIIK
jgi:hypothetical protein